MVRRKEIFDKNMVFTSLSFEEMRLGATSPYLMETLQAICGGHKQSQIENLLPWNYAAEKISV